MRAVRRFTAKGGGQLEMRDSRSIAFNKEDDTPDEESVAILKTSRHCSEEIHGDLPKSARPGKVEHAFQLSIQGA
jgi:hypothetical protein